MKKNRALSLIALVIPTLAGCGNSSNSQPSDDNTGGKKEEVVKGIIEIKDYGTKKFEAEDLITDKWVSDSSYNGKVIIDDAKASGGKYLAAGEPNSTGEVTFQFKLEKESKVVFSAAYAQIEDKIDEAIDMSKTYFYRIEDINPFTNTEQKMVNKRASADVWQLMDYKPQELSAGTYNVSLTVCENTPASCPNIDYIQFVTSDPKIGKKSSDELDNLTEDDIPDNDMRNLQQYKLVASGDWTKYDYFANGSDLSAPRGMKLRFEDIDTASKYYVQVSEKENDFTGCKTYETTDKFLLFQNAKLSTIYYYKAATSEAGLAAAAVKSITSTDQAPRVLNVPKILNFRDIGGWETTLIKGAKLNQGLYYRCAQFDKKGSSPSEVVSEGLPLIKDLGIKVDIDMRDSYNVPTKSPISTTDWPVEILPASIASGTESTRWEAFGDVYKKIFEAIAEADVNPVALHCTFGADRTGIATFFLEALLGMSIDDIKFDYVWTKYTKDRKPNPDGELAVWIEKTETTYTDEDCFANKMRAHLMTKGISKETLEHIREIFIPGYVAEA